MKIYLCNYATPDFRKSQVRLNNSARDYVDGIFSYGRDWLETTDFYKQNKDILDIKEGGGCYAWKPYVILETMKKLEDGDVLFYIDSGIEVKWDLVCLLLFFTKDGFFFLQNPTLAENYTKRDCFVAMGLDGEEYYKSHHVMGGFNGWIKNKKTIKFLEEWCSKCVFKEMISNDKSIFSPEMPNLIKHTFDQSILSLMVYRDKIHSYPITVEGSLVTMNDMGEVIMDVHREHDLTTKELIVKRIKYMFPASIKNKIKIMRNKLK